MSGPSPLRSTAPGCPRSLQVEPRQVFSFLSRDAPIFDLFLLPFAAGAPNPHSGTSKAPSQFLLLELFNGPQGHGHPTPRPLPRRWHTLCTSFFTILRLFLGWMHYPPIDQVRLIVLPLGAHKRARLLIVSTAVHFERLPLFCSQVHGVHNQDPVLRGLPNGFFLRP